MTIKLRYRTTKSLFRAALRTWTYKQICNRLNCSQSQISKWSNGKVQISYDRGMRLAAAILRHEEKQREEAEQKEKEQQQ